MERVGSDERAHDGHAAGLSEMRANNSETRKDDAVARGRRMDVICGRRGDKYVGQSLTQARTELRRRQRRRCTYGPSSNQASD